MPRAAARRRLLATTAAAAAAAAACRCSRCTASLPDPTLTARHRQLAGPTLAVQVSRSKGVQDDVKAESDQCSRISLQSAPLPAGWPAARRRRYRRRHHAADGRAAAGGGWRRARAGPWPWADRCWLLRRARHRRRQGPCPTSRRHRRRPQSPPPASPPPPVPPSPPPPTPPSPPPPPPPLSPQPSPPPPSRLPPSPPPSPAPPSPPRRGVLLQLPGACTGGDRGNGSNTGTCSMRLPLGSERSPRLLHARTWLLPLECSIPGARTVLSNPTANRTVALPLGGGAVDQADEAGLRSAVQQSLASRGAGAGVQPSVAPVPAPGGGWQLEVTCGPGSRSVDTAAALALLADAQQQRPALLAALGSGAGGNVALSSLTVPQIRLLSHFHPRRPRHRLPAHHQAHRCPRRLHPALHRPRPCEQHFRHAMQAPCKLPGIPSETARPAIAAMAAGQVREVAPAWAAERRRGDGDVAPLNLSRASCRLQRFAPIMRAAAVLQHAPLAPLRCGALPKALQTPSRPPVAAAASSRSARHGCWRLGASAEPANAPSPSMNGDSPPPAATVRVQGELDPRWVHPSDQGTRQARIPRPASSPPLPPPAAPGAAAADGHGAAALPALLVLLPGAMLSPKDYDSLLEAIKARGALAEAAAGGAGRRVAGGASCPARTRPAHRPARAPLRHRHPAATRLCVRTPRCRRRPARAWRCGRRSRPSTGCTCRRAAGRRGRAKGGAAGGGARTTTAPALLRSLPTPAWCRAHAPPPHAEPGLQSRGLARVRGRAHPPGRGGGAGRGLPA